jgi:diaminobutyrate-2-oxoglutarate transaminase
MLCGIVFDTAATASGIVERALEEGVIVLQSGPDGRVVTLAPPLTIEDQQLAAALDALEVAVSEAA